MKNEITSNDFLLESALAKKLYNNYAKNLPIIDYHCHLSPKEIYDNKQFSSLSELWLKGDHYKWRLLRAAGVDEEYITGKKDDYEKFEKWSALVPYLIGSPIYHWTHLELDRFFGIKDFLTPSNSKEIYDKVSSMLEHRKTNDLISMSNVEIVCTTDDPIDSLQYHKLIAKQTKLKAAILPAFRPDKLINIEVDNFIPYIHKLSEVVEYDIDNLDKLGDAIEDRIKYFTNFGCKLSDHALDVMQYVAHTEEEVNKIFSLRLEGKVLDELSIAKYKSYLLTYLGKLYNKYNWTQQYHIGAYRNLSTNKFYKLGPDVGNDAISDSQVSIPLARLLDSLDKTNELPRTIIYTLNPRDFEVAISIMQCFQSGIPGKIQFGAPWWFLDSITGIEKQFEALGNVGLLARFIGMLTDSRSFLSYPRHDYFRRILCNYIAKQVNKGLFSPDINVLGKLVSDISYYNAKEYFGFVI
ncbi:MAG: glucuronate isomerase [Acholeplasmatales bacterium]|jgi:glucuronate isomerase|nr:glucuronate isomerase [Acholeplasmatales bacterium]